MYENLKTLKRGVSTYIAREDAEKFIEICKEKQLGILGFEGIYHKDGSLVPDLELIADFSEIGGNHDFVSQSQTAAENILKHFPQGVDLYIDFVIRK